ncbi:MAG: HEPN domain-containing protein, partial [Candidatus Methylomirabilis sp.]
MREIKQALQEDAQRWLVEAEKDVKDAEMLLRHEGYYPLCRLACLAAEKAMRALLLGRGQESSK